MVHPPFDGGGHQQGVGEFAEEKGHADGHAVG
jgi:hypothetical protein